VYERREGSAHQGRHDEEPHPRERRMANDPRRPEKDYRAMTPYFRTANPRRSPFHGVTARGEPQTAVQEHSVDGRTAQLARLCHGRYDKVSYAHQIASEVTRRRPAPPVMIPVRCSPAHAKELSESA
jgi:hypothetical protein